jgi:hypothetical protein
VRRVDELQQQRQHQPTRSDNPAHQAQSQLPPPPTPEQRHSGFEPQAVGCGVYGTAVQRGGLIIQHWDSVTETRHNPSDARLKRLSFRVASGLRENLSVSSDW